MAIFDDVIKCIRNVNNELGDYYKENIYQTALYIELCNYNYRCGTEVVVPIFYKNVYVGFERADIVIYDKDGLISLIIELKSQSTKLMQKETGQLKKYLKNLKCETGILVNFYETPEILCITQDKTEKIPYDISH